jgi:protein-disulfide isomerase
MKGYTYFIHEIFMYMLVRSWYMEENASGPAIPFNITPVLVVILMLFSYAIGALKTKADFLEKGAVIPSVVAAAANAQPTGAAPPPQAPPPQAAAKKPEVTAEDHFRGGKDAQVTLVEYSDMECPFCKRFHPTMQQVISEYGDKVKWVYRHLPLSFHANAQKEAEATECAAKLGGNEAFWKYIDKIFERTTSNGTGFALTDLVPLAGEVGLNKTKFQTCLDSGEFTQKVKDQIATGSAEGVTGTPGTIIIGVNGDTQMVPGALPYDQIKPMIEKALSS